MDNMKKPDDDGLTRIQRLSPDQFDVVLGAHPSKQKTVQTAKTGSLSRTLVMLTALGIGAYALILHSHSSTPVASSVSQPSEVVPNEPVEASAEPIDTPAPASPAVAPAPVVVIIDREPVRNSATAATAAINPAKPAQGMVSAAYMAEYKHDLAHSSTPKRQVASLVQTVSIRERNSSNRYEAKWRIFNNHIEGDSVCANYPESTGEHIECRKAALEYFTDQCQEWTKRLDDDKADQIKQTQARFCEAAKSFNPAG